jgi:hypothetical protein
MFRYILLQILSISVFDKTVLSCAFQTIGYSSETLNPDNQLNLLGISLDPSDLT